MTNPKIIELTADIVAAHVEHNRVAVGDMAGLIAKVYVSLNGLSVTQNATPETYTPAVSVRASLKADSLTCLVCGSVQRALKRHVNAAHDLTPDQYRARFGLKSDYPMVAPESSAARSATAKRSGFGRKPGEKAPRKRAVVAK